MIISAAKTIQKMIQENQGVVRTSDVLDAGISRTTLTNLERNGIIVRIARGQYILPDDLPDDLFLWQQRMPVLRYSHETALYLHDLAERTPERHSATIPSDVRLSKTFPGDLKVYHIKPKLIGLGDVFLPSKMGHMVCSYDMERTICDVLRSRSRIDDQTIVAAIRNYANRSDKDMGKLAEYAAEFGMTKLLRGYLEVLL